VLPLHLAVLRNTVGPCHFDWVILLEGLCIRFEYFEVHTRACDLFGGCSVLGTNVDAVFVVYNFVYGQYGPVEHMATGFQDVWQVVVGCT
jgi:hypothetical protein